MKTHYLHISYQGQRVNGDIVLADCLLKITNRSLMQLREYLKNKEELKYLPTIISLTEISKGLLKMLSDKKE